MMSEMSSTKQMNKQNSPTLWDLYIEWLHSHTIIHRAIDYFLNFWYIWGGLIVLFLIVWLVVPYDWTISLYLVGIILVLVTTLIIFCPMNAVYGLMGTSGSIRLFFINFLFITLLFAGIYHFGFFQYAGISYDVNQPHIDYNLYEQRCHKEDIIQSDTLVYKRLIGSVWKRDTTIQETKLQYQPIGFCITWRNTILTALMQEPTDFFSAASTYNESMVDPHISHDKQLKEIELDKQKAKTFQWILIFQVLISWIFFGVFISLLYNKFRYES